MISLPWLNILLTAGIALAAAVAGVAGGWSARGVIADRDIAELKQYHADLQARAAQAAQAAEADYRRQERAMQERIADAERQRHADRQARVAAERRAAAGTERVLDAAGAWACRPTADTSIGPGSDEATDLRHLLEPLLRGYRDAVDAAEEHAADVRTLLAAWPVGPAPPR